MAEDRRQADSGVRQVEAGQMWAAQRGQVGNKAHSPIGSGAGSTGCLEKWGDQQQEPR